MSLFTAATLPGLTAPPPRPSAARQNSDPATRPKVTAIGKRWQKAAEVIGRLEPGATIHYATCGDWSMHDLIFHLLEQTGPAALWGASWSVTEDPCRHLVRELEAGRLTEINLLFDWRVKVRCPETFHLARHHAARVHLSSCHAKVCCLFGEHLQLAIVGSANFTNNPRIEAGVICADPAIAEFHRSWIAAEIARSDPFETAKKRRKS